jgi:hypothetical protein
MIPFYKTNGSFEPDNLISGHFQQVRKTISLKSKSGVLLRGSLIGRSKDGFLPMSKDLDPYGVLAADVDTNETLSVVVYLTGEFNKKYVNFFDGDQESTIEKLRNKSIFLS